MLAVSFPHFYFSSLNIIFLGFKIFSLYKYGNVHGACSSIVSRVAREEATHLQVPRLQYALDVQNTVGLEKLQDKVHPLTEEDYIRIDRAKITYEKFPEIQIHLSKMSSGAKKIHINNIPIDLIVERIAEFLQ